MIRKSKSLVLNAIFSLACIGFLFQSCEKEEFINEKQEYLEIKGNIDDPMTLTIPENIVIYRRARDRFHKTVLLKKNKLIWSVVDGKQLNISNDIFNSLVESYKNINERIEKNELIAYIDSEDQVRITISTKKIGFILRLKSGYEGDPNSTSVDYGNNEQDNLNQLVDFYNAAQSGNMADYFNGSSIDWSGNMMGDIYVSGQGYINGNYASYYISNGCSQWPDGSYNCPGNDICSYDLDSYSDRDVYKVLDCSGLPLITIQVHK